MRRANARTHLRRGSRALVVALCGFAAGCSAQDDQSHLAISSEDELIAAHQRLVAAYEIADEDAVVALLDPTPDLLIFHPAVESRFDGVDEVRQGLTRMFDLLGPTIWTEVHARAVVRGDVGWITSNLILEAPQAALVLFGRSTEIWSRRDGSWKLSHAHWSTNPETGDD